MRNTTEKYENGKNLDDVAKQFEIVQKHFVDKKQVCCIMVGTKVKKWLGQIQKTALRPIFGHVRLVGMQCLLVDVLDDFPENHPKRKELILYLNQLAQALIKQQDQTGLWYQVTDQGNRKGNYLEASGSAMFTYAFAKGVNRGYLPEKYKKLAQKAFDGMIKNLVKVSPEGFITITNVCSVAGLGGNPYRDGSYNYYVNEKKKDNDPKATGPFIMAALELNK